MWIWRGKRMFRQKYLPQLINRVCSKRKKFSMYSLSTSLWWYFSGHDLCEPNAQVILSSNFISTAKKVLDLFYQINTIWFPLPAGSSWLLLPFHSLDLIYSWDKMTKSPKTILCANIFHVFCARWYMSEMACMALQTFCPEMFSRCQGNTQFL